MNREIKFRGLRTDGKGWVYGDLFNIDRIVETQESNEGILTEIGSASYKYEYHKVIAESVGQLIHTEKNGREWWEGDFAKMDICFVTKNGFFDPDDEFNGYATGEVCLHIRHGLCLKNYRLFDSDNDDSEVEKTGKFKTITMSRTEIIGNIHEHKHLLS